MARAIFLAILLGLTTASAGCAGSSNGGGGNSLLSRQYELAKDLTVAVSANSVWHLDDSTNGGSASYYFRLTDDSSVDIGFMRTQNVQAWASGSTSNCYGCYTSVRSAHNTVSLDSGQWSLVIRCRNAFADCDGIMDSASYVS
ncbi:MAG: hypothetical protein ABR586_04710 [Thermoplasmatota archaeon]